MLPNELALPRPKRHLTPAPRPTLSPAERKQNALRDEIEISDLLNESPQGEQASEQAALLVRCVLLRIAAYRAAGVDLRMWSPDRLVQDEIRIVGIEEPELLICHFDSIGRALARALTQTPATGHRVCPGCDSQTCDHIPECTLHPAEYSE
jgi:hypothetical protein